MVIMLFICFALIIILLVFILLCLKKRQKYWKNRGFPSSSPNLFFGDWGEFVLRKKHIPYIVADIYNAFPNQPYVGYFELFKPSLMIRDLKLIESILVTDFSSFTDRQNLKFDKSNRILKNLSASRGKQWKDMRAMFVTTFSTNKLKLMLSLMNGYAKIMDSMISDKLTPVGQEMDMKDMISRFTIDVIGSWGFGLQLNTLANSDSEFRRIGQLVQKRSLRYQIVFSLRLLFPKFVSLLGLSEIDSDVDNFFTKLMEECRQYRKTESIRRNDLLQLILDIQELNRQDTLELPEQNNSRSLIDDNDIIGNMMMFYVGGFETTTITLSHCLYELSLNPEIQNLARDEVQTILKPNEEDITYDDLKKMKYIEMVISETLRKYPPGDQLFRICTAPYQIPGSSHYLLVNDRITIPVYALHHDEQYYPNPSKFEPERFTPENIASRPSFTYMPFGDGPRICIAIRFSLMEMKLCLAHLLSKYKFSPGSKPEIPLRVTPRSQIFSPSEIFLHVQPLSKH